MCLKYVTSAGDGASRIILVSLCPFIVSVAKVDLFAVSLMFGKR